MLFRSLNLSGHGVSRILGPLETEVMEICWGSADVSAREVLDVLNARRRRRRAKAGEPLAMTTVVTTLDRLYRKGMLVRRGSRGDYRYAADMSREELERRIVQRVIQELVEDFREPALSFLAEHLDMDEDELERLDEEIERRRRDASGS